MCAHYGVKTVLALALIGSACTLNAHPIFVSSSEPVVATEHFQPCVSPDEMLFAIPDSEERPKLWRDMSAKERAEIWPFLPRGMKKRYWRSMTNFDRKAMREELAPRYNDELRSRFVSPSADHMPAHMRKHVLTDEERDRMREQIREMHIQIYRYHHEPPSAVARPLPPSVADRPSEPVPAAPAAP